MKFQDHLIQIRNGRKLTQEDLARIAELTQAAVSHLERGRTQPNLETLCKLKHGLKMTWDELLGPVCDKAA